jgi:hypothetical protein
MALARPLRETWRKRHFHCGSQVANQRVPANFREPSHRKDSTRRAELRVTNLRRMAARIEGPQAGCAGTEALSLAASLAM